MKLTSSRMLVPVCARLSALYRHKTAGVLRVCPITKMPLLTLCPQVLSLSVGTPIQNSLEDVFSLLHFLRAEHFNDSWWYEE